MRGQLELNLFVDITSSFVPIGRHPFLVTASVVENYNFYQTTPNHLDGS